MTRVHPWQAARWVVVLCIACTPSVRAQTPSEPTTDPVPAIPEKPAEPLVPPAQPARAENGAATTPLAPQGGLAGLFNPTLGHLPIRADYRVTWFADERVAGQGAHLGYWQNDAGLSFPLWQDCLNEWSASANVRAELFHTGAILPDTHQPFPDELWNVRFGTGYRHLFDNGWIGGASLTVGSASDRPFHSINEMTVGANLSLRVPQGEHNAWLFTLNYSTNSEVLYGIPIPGIAYFWAPSEWFQATVGLPFANIIYRPLDDLTLELSYALLTNIHAKASYRFAPGWKIHAGFDWSNENYYLADRTDDKARLFYYDKRVTAGVQGHLAEHVTLDLSGGYSFDRFYFEGRRISDSHDNRVDVADGPFVAVRVEVRY